MQPEWFTSFENAQGSSPPLAAVLKSYVLCWNEFFLIGGSHGNDNAGGGEAGGRTGR
jgi:hypothetical protein